MQFLNPEQSYTETCANLYFNLTDIKVVDIVCNGKTCYSQNYIQYQLDRQCDKKPLQECFNHIIDKNSAFDLVAKLSEDLDSFVHAAKVSWKNCQIYVFLPDYEYSHFYLAGNQLLQLGLNDTILLVAYPESSQLSQEEVMKIQINLRCACEALSYKFVWLNSAPIRVDEGDIIFKEIDS